VAASQDPRPEDDDRDAGLPSGATGERSTRRVGTVPQLLVVLLVAVVMPSLLWTSVVLILGAVLVEFARRRARR
jgi:hypothetical protein